MKPSVLKPGYLVSLKTSIRGGINYRRIDLEPEHAEGDGRRARWETTREVSDAAEYDRAVAARGKARALITAACCASSFGLLCPTMREGELFEAIDAARAVAEAHNRDATQTRVDVYALVGRVASDDIEAARAIGAEVRELIEAMQAGIAGADPEAIREAANKARAVSGMLSAEVAGRVSAAIIEARSAAREIVKRVGKAGEQAAAVVAELATERLRAARFAVLDLAPEGDAQAPEIDAPARGGIDLPEAGTATVAAAPDLFSPALEL